MAQAGKSLDAHKLIYGSVKRSGDDYAVWLKMFDVRKAKIESWLTDTLAKRNADAAGVKAASARWFAKLTGKTATTGTIQVAASVSGATVSLDGLPVGITGEQPLVLADVTRKTRIVDEGGRVRQATIIWRRQTVPLSLKLRFWRPKLRFDATNRPPF